jgi:hypothetical protein
MGSKERAELLKKTLVMLETVEVDTKKIGEIERLVSQIVTDIEDSINLGEPSDIRLLGKQQSLVIKLQSILENLCDMAGELEQLKEKLKSAGNK